MKNVINLTSSNTSKFDKVKCEQLIEQVAFEALKSMTYKTAPLSTMQECTDSILNKAA